MHDLLTLVFAERMESDVLADILEGLYSVQKARSEMPAPEGVRAWRYVVHDMPAGFVERAFIDWLRTEVWLPTPADIRGKARDDARWYYHLKSDCRHALIEWAKERSNAATDQPGRP